MAQLGKMPRHGQQRTVGGVMAVVACVPILGLSAFVPTQAASPSSSAARSTSPWRSVLSEGFSSLDDSRWTRYDQQSWARDDARVLARNVRTSGGQLRVGAKHEPSGGRAYTSGDLTTAGKFTLPTYFKVTVRAKVPFQRGMWAAPLWFRPSDGSAGEIDLVETYGHERSQPLVHQTIHTEYGRTHRQDAVTYPFAKLPGSATDWHTYTVEKTKGQIRMWVDGQLTSTFNRSTASWFNTYYEAGKRWSLRVCLQVGGYDGRPDATTDWSRTTMKIDKIEAWVPR